MKFGSYTIFPVATACFCDGSVHGAYLIPLEKDIHLAGGPLAHIKARQNVAGREQGHDCADHFACARALEAQAGAAAAFAEPGWWRLLREQQGHNSLEAAVATLAPYRVQASGWGTWLYHNVS